MIKHESYVAHVSEEDAQRILSEESFHLQRKPLRAHIGFLRDVMGRGEFDGGEPIRFAAYAGRRHLINGQHRLMAIAGGGGTQELVVVVSHCDTVDEVAHLYAGIDRGRSRSVMDALKALGTFSEDGTGLNAQQLASLARCAPFFASDMRVTGITGASYLSKSAEGRASVMEQWLEPAKNYYAATAQSRFSNGRLFLNREVASVGIATYGDEPASERAETFWAGMAQDDGLSANDPRKQALEFIRKSDTQQKNKDFRRGQGYVAHGVAACWNAYFRDDDVRLVKVYSRTSPIRILGTRFAKQEEEAVEGVKRRGRPPRAAAPMEQHPD